MTLYEINAAYIAAIAAAEEQAAENAGEIDSAICDAIDAIEASLSEKVEAVASYIVNLDAEAEMLTAEAKRLKDRADAADRRARWLRNYLAAQSVPAGSYGLRRVSYRKSESVFVESADALPTEYLREKHTVEPDKTAIKDALKKGAEVPGARLIESKNISIK